MHHRLNLKIKDGIQGVLARPQGTVGKSDIPAGLHCERGSDFAFCFWFSCKKAFILHLYRGSHNGKHNNKPIVTLRHIYGRQPNEKLFYFRLCSCQAYT